MLLWSSIVPGWRMQIQMTSLLVTAALLALACVFGITGISVVIELFLIRARPKGINVDSAEEDAPRAAAQTAQPNVIPFTRADRIGQSRPPRS
jgi:hypothetical protein